ncbi:MAG: AEC family transporter [Desulfuromonadales bacterium]|uniref:AEC family transporter n=1 Tax=Desulfuromonas sp. KJ2020 TaxID=2919173 RepID=UPI0020A6F073|nr:AEC family transporter [Desulfuromonas sp. KJ2020]MCP3177916.1 AEC family transporter [Desulfuromonas sp. KJ2020]
MLFVNIILPVFILIFCGYLAEKKIGLDFRTLTNCSLYLFTPALVFSSLIRQTLELSLTLNIFFFMVLYTLSLYLLVRLIAAGTAMSRENSGALVLTTVVMNVGNFGLPLAYFAFGEQGLHVSVLTFVLFNIPLSTLAIVVAQGGEVPLGKALINTFKIPIFHAVALAFLLKAVDLSVPFFVLRAVELLGDAAIPLMLVLLGMQLARTRLESQWGFLSLATIIRLAIAPLIAWAITVLLAIDGTSRNVIILQTSTPSAVLPLLYALRFGMRPDLVAGTIFVTTLLSAGSLTIILYLLQG